MSDIRNFFGKGAAKKTPEKPEKPNKKKRYIISDSDDDDDDDLLITKAANNDSKKRKTESPQKAVEATNFFSSSKVKRVERPKVDPLKPKAGPPPRPVETKPVKSKKKKKKLERNVSEDVFAAMASDEDEELFNDASFMETLDQLTENKKQENIEPSPADKLSLKKKGTSWKEKVGLSPVTENESKKRPREDLNGSMKSLEVTPRAEPKTPQGTPGVGTPGVGTPRTESSESMDSTPSGNSDTPKSKSGYKAYLSREGPKNLGSKEIPVGAPNCLEGLAFVVTGVLDSIERDAAVTLIQRYGGRTTTAVSKKTDYLVAGDEAGVSKLEKAAKFKTKQLDEDGLFELIKTRSGKKSKYEVEAEKSVKAERKEEIKKELAKPKAEPVFKEEPVKLVVISEPFTSNLFVKSEPATQEEDKLPALKRELNKAGPSGLKVEKTETKVFTSPTVPKVEAPVYSGSSQLWTDKYRPKKVKDIIGQQGDKSNVKKLLHWLQNWSKWHMSDSKPPFNKDIGSHCKAALLSGSPGVGKTTAATICSQECGYTFVELNASDVRSKKSLQESVSDLLNNHTVNGLLSGKGASADKHVLIMDEVDGMAGNEDRGGVAELISLIKKSSIPIICICNDRNHQKIRALANYCFDLRFYKPRMETVKGAMMSVAFKEGLKIPPPAMQKIVESANCDIRQVLNHLCMWTATNKSISFDQAIGESDKAKKDTKMGIFDVARLFFTIGEETRKYSYLDYQELYFQDYSFCPMFVQENYPHSTPAKAKGNTVQTLRCLSKAADSLCEGNMVEAAIRMENWSLLPTQAHFSAILPGYYMRGGLRGRVEFPLMLGQMSKTKRCDSLLQELLNHMILSVSTDKRQLGMEYLPILKHKLSSPLIQKESEGIEEVIELMNNYNLLREDWDTVMELGTFKGGIDVTTQINTKTKSAFTRTFNKQAHATPYAIATGPAKKKRAVGAGDDELSGEEEVDDSLDAMIKAAQKKKPAAKRKAPAKGPAKAKAPPKKRAPAKNK